MSLHRKTAIVTGGNSGIGRAVALALARNGASVVIDYVADPEATDELEREIAQLGERAIGVEADVSNVDDLRKLVTKAVDAFGSLDVMVNNAGVETRTSVLDTTEDEYERVLAINLKSAFFGTQLAAKQMIEQGTGGTVVNISSVHEDWPMPGNTAYCCSKGGMRMLTRTAGLELGPRGVRVVGVGPGAVATPINAATMKDPAQMRVLDHAIPLGRMAEPREIGEVVAFVAGDGASVPQRDDGVRRRRPDAQQSRPVARRGPGQRVARTSAPPRAPRGPAGAAPMPSTNRSTALAKPSSSLRAVTRRAERRTPGSALPIAMLRPEWANINTSFGMSPIVAICSGGTSYRAERYCATQPLLASGWVTSR